ncbi:MAG: AraC family transcriptional regulator [Clostridia bacterium]|nr:AraC family transcriptional regulator [Clostridia bacterium]
MDINRLYMVFEWADDSIYWPNGVIDDAVTFDNISFVCKGEVKAVFDGEERILKRGDFAYYRCGDHRIIKRIEGGEELLSFGINFYHCMPNKINGVWVIDEVRLPFEKVETVPDDGTIEELVDLMWKMVAINRNQNAQAMYTAVGYLKRMLTILSEKKLSSVETLQFGNATRVAQTKEYIKKNYRKNVNIAAIAEAIGISQAYLIKLFKAETGMTPQTYLTSVRVDKAKELLKRGVRASDVAEMVGYSDTVYFGKLFKKCVGKTPKQFAEEHAGERTA